MKLVIVVSKLVLLFDYAEEDENVFIIVFLFGFLLQEDIVYFFYLIMFSR